MRVCGGQGGGPEREALFPQVVGVAHRKTVGRPLKRVIAYLYANEG